MKILGTKVVSYTSKEGYKVQGMELHGTYESEKVAGMGVSKVYVSERALEKSEPIKIGQEVEFMYNRYGKIEKINIIRE